VLRCEKGRSYKEYNKLLKRKISTLAKCECSLRLRDNFLSGSQRGLIVMEGEHYHELFKFFKGHKYA